MDFRFLKKWSLRDLLKSSVFGQTLVTKDEIWSYEGEYRMLRLGQRGLVEFNPMGLNAIILGARATPDTKAKIQDTVYELNRSRRNKIDIYYVELSKYTYDLHIPGHPFYENL